MTEGVEARSEIGLNVARPEAEIEKVTVRLSGEAMQRVRAIAARKGITINEFMRRAVSTEAFIAEETASGGRVLIEGRDARVKEVVFP